MPKKRGRPPKKQTTVQRGRGRPRKSVKTSESDIVSAGDVVSASIVAPIPPEYSPSKPFVTPVVYDGGLTPVFEPVEPVPHDAKFTTESGKEQDKTVETDKPSVPSSTVEDSQVLEYRAKMKECRAKATELMEKGKDAKCFDPQSVCNIACSAY